MWQELIKDADNMENIMIKLGKREDIWQDRFIWAIAKAQYDCIKAILRLRKDLYKN